LPADSVLEKSPSWFDRASLFAQNFFRHPKMLGSLIPSSRFLVDRVLREIDWNRAQVIVEFGPGVGVFTTEILRRMRPDATLITFETNADFVSFLRRSIQDRRLRLIHGSAEKVGAALKELGYTHADYLLSGIPYTTMPAAVRDTILDESRVALGATGVFLGYQFSRASLPFLRRVFPNIRVGFEPLNLPPATTYIWRTEHTSQM
jgi:phospholipid N-methyltransferase